MYRLPENRGRTSTFPRLRRSPVERDEELERIKERKVLELLKASKPGGESKGREEGEGFDRPLKVTDESFEEFIGRHPLAVVDCWADWCHPCRILGPIVDALAREYAGRVAFGKLNIDENRRIPARFGIMSIPTLLIAKNGRIVERIVGAVPKQAIERVLEKYSQDIK